MSKAFKESDYEGMIEDLRCKKSEDVIAAGVPKHASAIMIKFFRHAQGNVSIFPSDSDLSTLTEAAVKKEMLPFLKGNTGESLHVLFANTAQKDSPEGQKLLALAQEFPGTSDVRILTGANPAPEDRVMIVGNEGYRFVPSEERDHAIACFNNQDKVMRFQKGFDRLFESAQRCACG